MHELTNSWRLGPQTCALLSEHFYAQMPFTSRRPDEAVIAPDGTELPEIISRPTEARNGPTDPALLAALAGRARELTWHQYRRSDTCEALTAEDIAVVVPHVAQAGAVRAMLARPARNLGRHGERTAGLRAARRRGVASDGRVSQRRIIRARRGPHVRNPVPSPGDLTIPPTADRAAAGRRRRRRSASRTGAGGAGRALTGPPASKAASHPTRHGVGWELCYRVGRERFLSWVAVVSSVLGQASGAGSWFS